MTPTARTTNLIAQESGNELIVYDLRYYRAIYLNHSSMRIWQMCDGTKSIPDIADALGTELGIAVDKQLIMFALNRLAEVGLLQDSNQVSIDSQDMSRQQLVKRIGLAAVLPVVTSARAPTAAEVLCEDP